MYAARKRNKQDDCDRKSHLLNKLVSSSTRTITKVHNETKHNVISWSYDVQGHVHKCQTGVERYCELANKTVDALHTVSMPCLDDHQVKKGGIGNSGRLVWSLFANRVDCILLRIGRHDILRTVSCLARHVTQWNRTWDRRSARQMSYHHHTGNYRQYCHVGNKASECK